MRAWRRHGLRAVVLTGTVLIAGCKLEVAFSGLPPVGPVQVASVSPLPSVVMLDVAVDIAEALQRIEAASLEKPARLRGWLDDIECRRSGSRTRCAGAALTGQAIGAGPVELQSAGDDLVLVRPVDVQIQVRGTAWLADEREQVELRVKLHYPLMVKLDAQFTSHLSVADTPKVEPAEVVVMGRRLALASLLGREVQLAASSPSLRELRPLQSEPGRGIEIGRREFGDLIERAWLELQEPIPIELGGETHWLSIEPSELASVGLVRRASGATAHRLGLTARVRIASEAGRGMPPMMRPPRPSGWKPAEPPRTRIALSTGTSLAPLRRSLAASVAAVPELPARARNADIPLRVRVEALDVFAARGKLGLDARLGISTPVGWIGAEGRMYAMAEPKLTVRGDAIRFEDAEIVPALLGPRHRRAHEPGFVAARIPRLPGWTDVVEIDARAVLGVIERSAEIGTAQIVDAARARVSAALARVSAGALQLQGSWDTARLASYSLQRDSVVTQIVVEGLLTVKADEDRLAVGRVPSLQPTAASVKASTAASTGAGKRRHGRSKRDVER